MYANYGISEDVRRKTPRRYYGFAHIHTLKVFGFSADMCRYSSCLNSNMPIMRKSSSYGVSGVVDRNANTPNVDEKLTLLSELGERGGSVVECRTPEREVRGSKPTAAVLCPWARHFTPRKYWLITQEAVAPSRHDWKIVDWDVKPQHKQTIIIIIIIIISIF